MSIFGSIMHKIFGASAVTPAGRETAPATTSPTSPAAPATGGAPDSSNQSEPVDVEAILTALAAGKGGGGNWQTSIVDLLKLLDLDSSLAARKELATELS